MLEPDTMIGGYRVVREIGRGAMADVYEAIQIKLRRKVALKILRPDSVDDDSLVLQRLREAETAGTLDHPNIVTVLERGRDGETSFVAMELVRGPTLAEVIRHARGLAPIDDEAGERLAGYPGPTTSTEDRVQFALDVGIQVAEALQIAHEHRVIHHAVKPSDIILAAGRVKVSDFGLATTAESFGNPAHASPELALGLPGDVRSDVYSLGATLFELVTLHPPIEGRSRDAVLLRISTMYARPARKVAPEISKDLETILGMALRKEPSRRYPSAMAMAEDLDRFQRGEAVIARPDGPFRKLWRLGKR